MSFRIIAKSNLSAHPHSWTKGLDYQVVEKDTHFILASNEGSVTYVNEVKKYVFEGFYNIQIQSITDDHKERENHSMIEMTKEEREELRLQAIEAEERRMTTIQTFLDSFPLDSDTNKTIALELATRITDIEESIKELKEGPL